MTLFLVPLIYIDAANDDGIGGADIIYQKEIIKKIPEKSACLKNGTIQSFVKCRKESLKILLDIAFASAKVKCMGIYNRLPLIKSLILDIFLPNTVASSNSVSLNCGISRYSGYIQLTHCPF